MLVIVLSRHRIARASRIAGELHVFFGYMRGGAADFDIGPVGLENPGHRILAAPVIIIIVVIVPVTQPLVVLTVSHVLPLLPALNLGASDCGPSGSPQPRPAT